ncbi:hypothetical protein, partial [Leptospira selangorensis]|uniref:hypothetical protein n=1 Tax=Leptospira selangorensis TaxID=2484982 RepID=UPI001AEFAC97
PQTTYPKNYARFCTDAFAVTELSGIEKRFVLPREIEIDSQYQYRSLDKNDRGSYEFPFYEV